MTLYLPNHPELPRAVTTHEKLVVCFCAEWCDTCGIYREKFAQLAASFPEAVFVWADIEEYPLLLGDEDVENFPTILIEQKNQVLFFGTMLPHISQLERLLQTLSEPTSEGAVTTNLPNIREALMNGGGE